MNKILITVIHPISREKTTITAYSRNHAKKIIQSAIENDNRRIKLDSNVINELVNELRKEYNGDKNYDNYCKS